MGDGTGIEVMKRDGIGYITFDRAEKHNAFTKQMLRSLNEVFERWSDDGEVRVIVIRANGERAFSTGADLGEMVDEGPSEVKASNRAWIELFERIETVAQPVIASVHGYCIAGGTELTLACDLIVASDDAQFGLTEIKVGVVPGAGACVRLPRWVTPAIAKEILMLGHLMPAAEAHRLGLVNRVVSRESLVAETESLARELATRPPRALALAKKAVNEAADMDLRKGIAFVLAEFALLFGTADQVEGMSAFLEKRPPLFTGR